MGLVSVPSYQAGLGTGVAEAAAVGTGDSAPGGVESIIEYNGLYLNDRSTPDAFLITSIDGLHDADVRDSRLVNPGADGETYFNAYYGGRTIVLTGRIRAMSVPKLRDMQLALRAAFTDISTERQLVFHSGNMASTVYIKCKKSQPIVMGETQQNFNATRDFQVTLRASDPHFYGFNLTANDFPLSTASAGGNSFATNYFSTGKLTVGTGSTPTVSSGTMKPANTGFTQALENIFPLPYKSQTGYVRFRTGASVTAPAGGQVGITLKRQDANNYLSFRVNLNGGSSTIGVYETNNGTTTLLGATATVSLSSNSEYLIFGTMIEPNSNVCGGGIYSIPGGTPAGWPTGITLLGSFNRTIATPSKFGDGTFGQLGFQFQQNTDFQISYFWMASGPYGALTGITNRGNAPALPIVRIYGQISGSSIGNLTLTSNNKSLILRGGSVIVPLNQYIELDFAQRTAIYKSSINDAFVGNAYAVVDPASQWPEIPQGTQSVDVTTSSQVAQVSIQTFDITPKITVIVRDTYL